MIRCKTLKCLVRLCWLVLVLPTFRKELCGTTRDTNETSKPTLPGITAVISMQDVAGNRNAPGFILTKKGKIPLAKPINSCSLLKPSATTHLIRDSIVQGLVSRILGSNFDINNRQGNLPHDFHRITFYSSHFIASLIGETSKWRQHERKTQDAYDIFKPREGGN